MKNLVRLASTFVALVLAVTAQQRPAQDPQAALARARLVERQEGDLAAAQAAYRALLDDAAAAAVHGEAALHLGTLLWRLDQKDAAKPLLERAAAAGGAVAADANAVLAGQGEQGKLAAERLTKARALVARAVEVLGPKAVTSSNAASEDAAVLQDLGQQLTWLGEQGAAALVEQLERSLPASEVESIPAGRVVKTTTRATHEQLASWLWAIGTKPAVEFLQRVAADPDVAHRRAITAPLQQAKSLATDLHPVLLQFARDPDLTGEVVRNVARALRWLPLDTLLGLLHADDAEARASGLGALAQRWKELAAAERERVVAAGEAIDRARRSQHGREARAAWELLWQFGQHGPAAGRMQFLAVASQAPLAGGIGTLERARVDDAMLRAIATAAEALGPLGQHDRKPAQVLLDPILRTAEPAWTSAAEEHAIRLLELGYVERETGQGSWLPHTVRNAQTQLPRLIRALPNAPFSEPGLNELAIRPLDAESFAALREVLDAVLSGREVRWNDALGLNVQTMRVGERSVRLVTGSTGTNKLLRLVADTRLADAATWLAGLRTKRPELAYLAAQWLTYMSVLEVAAARDALRELLVWEGSDTDGLPPRSRAEVFAELARAGDTAAIPLFPRAYELGLESTSVGAQELRATGAGIAFLALHRQSPDNVLRPWFGYGDGDLVAAWRTLLDSKVADAVWDELTPGVSRVGPERPTTATQRFQRREFEVPGAVLPLLAERLLQRWNAYDAAQRPALQEHVLRAFSSVRRDDARGDTPLGRALRALLQADDTTLALSVFHMLPREVAALFADEALAALRRAPAASKHFAATLLRQGVELPVDDWRAVLAAATGYPARDLLQAIPPSAGAAVREQVEAKLGDDVSEVRVAAVAALQRVYGADAVATLLPLLQASNGDVRKAARDALDQLREEHERRAFWTQAGSGIDTRPQSAAAKLLAQAQPDQPKAQRLLAIRSLAVLAAPEALPYLIDHTNDADAEIAAAARAAVAQIHAKAGAPAPAAGDEKK